MRRTLVSLAVGAYLGALMDQAAFAQAAPELSVTRLDCGTSAGPGDVSKLPAFPAAAK